MASTTSPTEPARAGGRDLAVDRLPADAPSLEVVRLAGTSHGAGTDRGPRRPHRHDYHELIWTRSGGGRHLIDGHASPVEPGTVTLIGRGQVHVLEHATDLHGAVVRFGEELLHGDRAARADPGWLLATRSARTVHVPAGDVPRLEAAVDALAAETLRPADSRTVDVERHLLSTLLLWVERWYDATRTQHRDADDADLQLYRRFSELLEHDFAGFGDAAHYAEALRVPQAALSRVLTHVSGRGIKELVVGRRMLEAERLLRFTDLTVGEVAFRAGFRDPLYFSRAFKRHHGVAPAAYRDGVRGRAAADG